MERKEYNKMLDYSKITKEDFVELTKLSENRPELAKIIDSILRSLTAELAIVLNLKCLKDREWCFGLLFGIALAMKAIETKEVSELEKMVGE